MVPLGAPGPAPVPETAFKSALAGFSKFFGMPGRQNRRAEPHCSVIRSAGVAPNAVLILSIFSMEIFTPRARRHRCRSDAPPLGRGPGELPLGAMVTLYLIEVEEYQEVEAPA